MGIGGEKIPMPHIVRAVNTRTFREIHDEIRATQAKQGKAEEAKIMRWFTALPAIIRRLFYCFVIKNPHRVGHYSGTVALTAVGMFGKRGGMGDWGRQLPPDRNCTWGYI